MVPNPSFSLRATLALGLFGLGCTSRPSPDASFPVSALTDDEGVVAGEGGFPANWGPLLFPTGPAPSAPSAPVEAPPAAVAPEPEAPPTGPFPRDPGAMVNDSDLIRFAGSDPCDAIRSMVEAEREANRAAGLPVDPVDIDCRRIAAPPFQPSGPYLGLSAIHYQAGGFAANELFLRTKDGLFGPVTSWDVDDPEFPGCPSIPLPVGIESVRVVKGTLVIVGLAETRTQVEVAPEVYEKTGDLGSRQLLHRTVTLVRPFGEGLQARDYVAGMGGTDFGTKLQPSRRAPVWSSVRWDDWFAIQVDDDGRVALPPSE